MTRESRECPITSSCHIPGTVVSTPDGLTWKVLALSSNGDERVLEGLDGPHAGPASSSPLRRSGSRRRGSADRAGEADPVQAIRGSRIRDDNHNVTAVPGPPTVVPVDFKPEMFANPVLGPAAIRLENGPYDGVIPKLPHMSAEYEVPAANPDQGGSNPSFVPAIYRRTKRRDPTTAWSCSPSTGIGDLAHSPAGFLPRPPPHPGAAICFITSAIRFRAAHRSTGHHRRVRVRRPIRLEFPAGRPVSAGVARRPERRPGLHGDIVKQKNDLVPS